MGSRYGGLKQIDAMGPNGETVLDYSIFDAARAGFDRVVFVIRKDFEQAFREGIGGRASGRIEVDYAFQELSDLPQPFQVPAGRTKPWGTAHAILAGRGMIDCPFAVVNADDFYGADSYVKAAVFLNTMSGNECAMVAYPLEKTLSEHGMVNRGICEVDGGGNLAGVREYSGIRRERSGTIVGADPAGGIGELVPGVPVSMNFWAFPEVFMDMLAGEFEKFLSERGREEGAECYLPTVVDDLIRQEILKCRVLEADSKWFGVTYPGDKAHVAGAIARMIREGGYPERLE